MGMFEIKVDSLVVVILSVAKNLGQTLHFVQGDILGLPVHSAGYYLVFRQLILLY